MEMVPYKVIRLNSFENEKEVQTLKISLFSGGSGNERFVNLIKDLPGVELNIIVNGYDDESQLEK